ncbi:GTPase-activating protein [Phlyctochytrium bullatum]|nr:GTPase-activating protein [Phlyctochytrium bullatum]
MSKAEERKQDLVATYKALQTRESPHEKVIRRDIPRTFPKHEYFAEGGEGQALLLKVVCAYSIYDPEVGYCQGLAFSAGALLLNMGEEDAFCVLVTLMYDYGFRQIFVPTLSGLDLKVYQFDRLLDEIIPQVSKHFKEQGVRSNMYVPQWILDLLFLEGIDVMHRFGLALLRRNTDAILSLEFEQLLEFLKTGLFDIYIGHAEVLVQHAYLLNLPKSKLERLATAYKNEFGARNVELVNDDQLRLENRRLETQLRKTEETFKNLNLEHIALQRKYNEIKEVAENLKSERDELRTQLGALRILLDSSKGEGKEERGKGPEF